MPDLCVTVPRTKWDEWLKEGDCAGDPETGEEWGFFIGGAKPDIKPGERVYVVAHDRLRGYSVLTRLIRKGKYWVLCRKGNAVACTLKVPIKGFRGFRYVWWARDIELPFPSWKTP